MPDRRPATARAATIAENGAEAAPASLHRRILADIEARILSGEWPPGHRIPFEHELTTQYGCSRMTVSKVLTQLARAGLIARRRRAGTFVTRPHSQAAVLEIHDIKAEAAALGRAYRFEIAARRKRKGLRGDRAWFEPQTHGALLDLTCRHFAGSQPFCLEERLINLSVVPEAGWCSACHGPLPNIRSGPPALTGEPRRRLALPKARPASSSSGAPGAPSSRSPM
jgi:GntR family histidine utilization transcriptional repressor